MNIKADREVMDFLKVYLAEWPNKAVRFRLAEVCCGQADLEMIYDKVREDDICIEIEGIKFVASRQFAFLINNVELERTEIGVDIKKRYFC
ncbi:MAG: hypothetical protein Q8930_10015 [Bacillota bacterium]|nr:hypothetical protein [Bacillota bacterium]